MRCSARRKFLSCLLFVCALVCGLVVVPNIVNDFTAFGWEGGPVTIKDCGDGTHKEREATAELLNLGLAPSAPEQAPTALRGAPQEGAEAPPTEPPAKAEPEPEPERPQERDATASQADAPTQPGPGIAAKSGSRSDDRREESEDQEAPRGHALPTLAPEGPGQGATARILDDIQQQSRNISAKCDSWYGHKMLTDHRKAVVEVCKPESGAGSHVYCLERKPFDEARFLCVAENVEMVSHQTWVPDHKLRLGTFGCTSKVNRQSPPKWSWYEKATMENLVSKPSLACRHVVEHPVILYKFWESPNFRNFYEALADFLNVFEAALTLAWDFNDLEVMATNLKENNTFYPIFESIRRLYGGRGIRYSTQWYKNGTCFRSVALPPSPGLCSLSANKGRQGQTECRAPVIAATASVMRGLFPEMRSQPRLAPNCYLTLMHRGEGKRSMNSKTMVDEVVRLLKAKSALQRYSPVMYDPIGKPLHMGLAAMASTALLFGIHGAGLSHALFLEPGAVLLELFCGDRTQTNGHFRTIAAMVGAGYAKMSKGTCSSYTAKELAPKVLESIPTHSQLSCLR